MNSSVARLRWLIAAQLSLTLMQLVAGTVPPFNVTYGPLAWALLGMSIEPPMFLAFWCVFAAGPLRARVLALCFGAVWMAGISAGYYLIAKLALRASLPLTPPDVGDFQSFAVGLARSSFFLACLSGCLAAARFSQRNLRLVLVPGGAVESKPTQFSLRNLFVLTLVAAVYLGLARAYRYPWPESLYDGRDWISSLLLVLTLSANTLLASWVALSGGFGRRRACIALILALVAGLAYCAASVVDPVTTWSWLTFTLLLIELPTAILIGSLVVLRSYGYRLVPTSH
jgi:hypothetical protein